MGVCTDLHSYTGAQECYLVEAPIVDGPLGKNTRMAIGDCMS